VPESYPLREQKKKRTHAQLIEAADQIFLQQGYNNTTMEDVAARAGMHVQTVYRHFPAKIDLAIEINTSYFDAFERDFRNKNLKTLVFWRQWVQQSLTDASSIGVENLRKSLRDRFKMHETPAAFYEVDDKYEHLLATGIAQDMGVSLNKDKRPMLIACMLWSSHKQMLRDWAIENRRVSLVKEALSIVDTAVEMLSLDQLR